MNFFYVLLIILILSIIFGPPIYLFLMYNSVNNKGLNDAKSLK
jgi:hypothetical protein